MKDSKEISSVRLFWRGYGQPNLRVVYTVPVKRTRKFAESFMSWIYCLLILFLSICPSSKMQTYRQMEQINAYIEMESFQEQPILFRPCG